MLKKMSLRMRVTLVASLFLLISCVTLTFLSNMSASRMIQAAQVLPPNGSPPMTQLEPALSVGVESYHLFQRKTGIATVVIVIVGSVGAYFAAGYAMKPIQMLSKEVKRRNVRNLDEPLTLPQASDEVQELTISFNHMMAELQKSFLLQKQFSADAAHELRTPLAVMQAKLDVFALENSGDPQVNGLISSLDQQMERLSKLIADLLWFSQDMPLENMGPVPLYPLFCDVAEELSGLADERGVSVQIEQTECYVVGQDRLLERVFYNLIENAIKYSPPCTQVDVTVQKGENCVQIKIVDQGEGIPEPYRDTVFEPFFRVDRSRSRAIGGSGLGLAVCKKILERHNAQICVLPNHPKGSIFQIAFPS